MPTPPLLQTLLTTPGPSGYEGDAAAVWDVNVMGTRHALDAAVRAEAQRFVQLSSVLAFSWDFPDGVDERHPVRPNGAPYVDTKVASEQVVLQAHAAGEIACTVIRPGDVWGPRSRPWTSWCSRRPGSSAASAKCPSSSIRIRMDA